MHVCLAVVSGKRFNGAQGRWCMTHRMEDGNYA